MALASVSVDLDSLGHYCRIHGLPESVLSAGAAQSIYREALPRFAELFAETGMRATFFVVGRDLDDPASAQAVRSVSAAGHEIGNHTFVHDYALTRKSPGEIGDDVARGGAAILRLTGTRPAGFRAPGYTLTSSLVRALCAQGYRYDSSVFPSAPYWAAKAAVMAGLAVMGRESKAILDRPRVLRAPRLPYRPDLEEPYRRGRAGLVELPITVHPLTRVPIIGTTLTMLPPRALGALWRGLTSLPFVNLELHGIDLLDATDVGCPELAASVRDLAIPFSTKRARLKQALRRLTDRFEVVALAAVAERVAV
ncbi:MAG: polysaccharide deacetylase family protein [Deltaproteobacteria bacterium]|nr:polysaccharide deacetylase family protein [Deltaproteobacteria bacterium]